MSGLTSRVLPGLAAAAVLLDGDHVDAVGHVVGVEDAGEVVDFVGDEPGDAALEHGGVGAAVYVLMLDLDAERSGDLAAYVEEAQASFVLLVLIVGLVDDLWVQQCDDLAARCADNGSGSS